MEEKVMILKMLQEGKITTDEAVKLLEALEKSGTNTNGSSNIGSNPQGSKMNDFKDDLTAKLNDMKLDEKLNKFGEKASKFAETIGEKATKLAGQLGENINSEKINSNTEKFTEEFAKRMESLGQDIAESATKFADAFASQFGSLFEAGYDKYRYNSSYTYPVSDPASSSIYLRSSNFSIKAAPNEANEIVVNIYANSNYSQLVIDEYFKAIIEGNTYRLTSNFPGSTWGKIELQLPKGMDVISLSTDNAKCELNETEANFINSTTSNGKLIINSCKANEMELLTDNAKVVLDAASARTANIRTSNSKIAIEKCYIDNIDAKTSNGSITGALARKGDALTSSYIFNTSNGKIDLAFKPSEGFEHMVDAHTSMGSIEVSLPSLTYSMDKRSIGMQSTAQIKSENFDTASNKLTIKANTSNAPIVIGSIR